MTVVTDTSRTTVAPSRSVLYGVLTLAAISFGGAAISLAGDLSPTFWDAMGPEGRLSIPLPMVAFQVAMAVAAASRRRWLVLVGSGAIAVALLLGVISGFFDGGYGDDRMTAFERAYQVLLISSLVVVGVVAARRFVRVVRRTDG
jgi:hypothetical protein